MAASLSSCQFARKTPSSSLAPAAPVGTHDKGNASTVAFHNSASASRSALAGWSCASRRGVVPVRVAVSDSLSDIEDNEFPLFPITPSTEKKSYPAGLQTYETMVVLRPDLSEEERVSVTERYEEVLVAGGAVDVEMFNRGLQPLAYRVKTKNMVGALAEYEDGIYLLFTYVTKPEAQAGLQQRLVADDDVIRSSTFKLKA